MDCGQQSQKVDVRRQKAGAKRQKNKKKTTNFRQSSRFFFFSSSSYTLFLVHRFSFVTPHNLTEGYSAGRGGEVLPPRGSNPYPGPLPILIFLEMVSVPYNYRTKIAPLSYLLSTRFRNPYRTKTILCYGKP